MMKTVSLFSLVITLTLVTQTSAQEKKDLLEVFKSEFIKITPGKDKFPQTFKMGSEKEAAARPVHEVTMDYNFSMAKYEVPQNLWTLVMGNNPSEWGGPRNSVEMMTFSDAHKFCQKVTKVMREKKLISETEHIRLPSEKEWEYCARAGTTTIYSFGDEIGGPDKRGRPGKILGEYAWSTHNAAGNDPPVGALKPNPWGFYDMHGYLWEMCLDPWRKDYNATQEEKVTGHAMRGGSWKDKAPLLSSSSRIELKNTSKGSHIGLRCVLIDTKKDPNF